jgi:hypothetical protein
MAVSRKKRFVVVLGFAVALLAGVSLALMPREPRYRGATIHEWISRGEPMGFQQYMALRALAADHLSLLVSRIAYDPGKDKAIALSRKLPLQLQRTKPLQKFLNRKTMLGREALIALETLDPSALLPAVPQLRQVAREGTPLAAQRAMLLFEAIGSEALPDMIRMTEHADPGVAILALIRMLQYPDSPFACQALTNGLTHPNPLVRQRVHEILDLPRQE